MLVRMLPALLLRASILAPVLAPILLPVAALAVPSYTVEDVKACAPDALRLCKDKLADLDAVEACMRANVDRLRPACRLRMDRER